MERELVQAYCDEIQDHRDEKRIELAGVLQDALHRDRGAHYLVELGFNSRGRGGQGRAAYQDHVGGESGQDGVDACAGDGFVGGGVAEEDADGFGRGLGAARGGGFDD